MNHIEENTLLSVDFHSHVLPAMDDGSQSVKQSLDMLEESRRQGIRTMIATPHFYPERETPEAFLTRRARSVEALLRGGYGKPVHPRVCAGAEVAHFPGIGRCMDLKKLCIEGTRIVLIEMPFSPWTGTMIEDIVMVRTNLGLIPALAHIDRYPACHDYALIKRLVESGVILQVNASVFESIVSRKRGLHMLMSGSAQLLGSDCHNCTTRPQCMIKAVNYLKKYADPSLLPQMAEFSSFLLAEAKSIGPAHHS